MTKRSAITVFLLSSVTCGIYWIIWLASTKDEMNARGAKIPSAIHLFIPILGLIWIWKWCQAAEQVTGGKVSAGTAMIASLLGFAPFVTVNAFNETP